MSYRLEIFKNGQPAAYPIKHYMSALQARHGMNKFAYQALEGFGKLDTQAAYDTMANIKEAFMLGFPPSVSRSISISNTGYSMLLCNTAKA